MFNKNALFEAKELTLTIPEMKAADTDFEDFVVGKVEYGKDHWVYVTHDSCGFGINRAEHPCNIRVGDKMRRYPASFGATYGIDLNGIELFWKTPKERAAENAVASAKYDRESRERYAREKPDNDAKIAALSEPLRKRMERFRADGDESSQLMEGYELYACTQADWLVGLVTAFMAEDPSKSAEQRIEEFRALPNAEQVALGMDDGHSGNTFGGMCGLALRVLNGLEV